MLKERNQEIYKVTLIGGVVNVVLLLFKFVAGIGGRDSPTRYCLLRLSSPSNPPCRSLPECLRYQPLLRFPSFLFITHF